MVKQLKSAASDEAARQEFLCIANKIILAHGRLGIQIAGRYCNRLGSTEKSDDLVGEAMLAIAEAVHSAPQSLEDDCITPYIVSRIHSSISLFLAEDRMIAVPYSTFRLHKGARKAPARKTLRDKPANDDVLSEIMTLDMLAQCCQNPTDRKIIEFRGRGYRDAEIAAFVGLSTSTVARKRNDLHNRFLQLQKGLPNVVDLVAMAS